MNSSKQLARWFLLSAAIAISGSATAQQAAGRVLVAVGTVSIERAGTRIPGAAGTEVQKGDTIQVGPQSNAQLRLADESIVALRADTTFRITEFNFTSGGGEKDNAFFSLLKGGIRTVTGLIGKSDPNSYRVDTPTSTIGIRGTHYTLRVCNDDCVETTTTANGPAAPIYLAAASSPVSDAGPIAQLAQASGTPVPNGTYGSVTEGRISVSNQSGVREFGADQYFRVASRTSAPQQLIGPPSFLRDRLEGRGRAKQQRTSGQQGSSGGSQQSGSGGSQQGGSGSAQQGGTSPSSGGSSESSASSSSSSSSSGSESASTVAPTGAGGGSGDSRTSSSVATATVPVAITPTLTQVTNQVSTAGPASVLQLTGTSQNNIYRFAATGLNIPGSCSGPICDAITAADLIVTVNPTSQTARIVLVAKSSTGSMLNVSNSYGDFPVTIVGGQLVINGTANSADYPTLAGSFRCSDCGVGNSVSVLQTTTYSVTISGSTATLTFTGTDPAAAGGGSFTFTAPLTLTTAASSLSAVIAGRNIGASGGAGFYVQTNASGQPVFFGEPLQLGNNLISIGTAVNTTVGTSAATGNLTWGTWTGGAAGATGIASNYLPFTQSSGSVSPWIIGDQTNTLPASLGVVSFTPFVALVGNGFGTTGTLNSATMTADFLNRNVSLNINATNAPAGATFQMNGSSAFSAINGRFSAGFTSVTCTGGSCGTGNNGNFNGFFAGANAPGAGVSFAGSNTGAAVFGIIGFKR